MLIVRLISVTAGELDCREAEDEEDAAAVAMEMIASVGRLNENDEIQVEFKE